MEMVTDSIFYNAGTAIKKGQRINCEDVRLLLSVQRSRCPNRKYIMAEPASEVIPWPGILRPDEDDEKAFSGL